MRAMADRDRDIRFYGGTAPAYKKAFQRVVERAKSQLETKLNRVLWDGEGRATGIQRRVKKAPPR